MSPLLVQEIDDVPEATQRLSLTPVEETLRHLLLDVAAYIDANPRSRDDSSAATIAPADLARDKLVLRFTGGWVRDKLLGVPSHDIDVAINNMTGFQFGLRMKDYLEIPGHPEKYGLEGVGTSDKAGTTAKSKTVGGLHKIEANPEKSKHLETVTTKILGLDIDLVNLRKETYTEESRNPQMEFGTPEEDALRRDATVNAMFYNLNTEQVEDFTGRGHEDLKHKILRTPLEPYQTFKDDPLRVLRLIRFASRLGYEIDPTALKAMQNANIKDALRRKISRERIGIEVEKALKGPDPHEALRLIFSLGLYETIFSDPTTADHDHYQPDIQDWQAVLSELQSILDDSGPLTVLIRDDEDTYLAWQLAALTPYKDAPQPEAPEPGRRAPPPIATSVAREGIKATNKVCDIITAAVKNQPEITVLVDQFNHHKRRPDKKADGEDASARDVLGMAIRRWGPSWRSQLVFAMLTEVADDPGSSSTTIRNYASFVQHLTELNLLEAYDFKPLMDGKALAKALGTPPGPWMKDALDVVMAYQLRNPNSADAASAIAEVRQSRNQQNGNGGELTSSLIQHFLKLTIRPLFLKAKPTSVTDTGRKNTTTVLPPKMTMESMDDSVNRPWKSSKDAYVLMLLQWCVQSLTREDVEKVWPLIIPPLLTLVDDWEVKYKILGAEMTGSLLQVMSQSLLAKTGLGEVFSDALMPCLAYLPTITPDEESIALLNKGYPALLALATIRYKTPSPARTKFLDTIIRKGFLHGYSTCSHLTAVVSTLFIHLAPILNALGIESVKHLRYILPTLTETLCRPFAEADLHCLLSATRALQAVILNGWPRMLGYRGEVLRGLTGAWVKLGEMDGEEVRELKREMREAVEMLRVAIGDEVDFEEECGMLIKADRRLSELLIDEVKRSEPTTVLDT